MVSYLASFTILILSFASAILLDRRWKNLAIGIAGGLVTAVFCWFVATMLLWFVQR